MEYDLEFPCEGTSLYGHWNPLGVNTNDVPMEEGTLDQYEMGDLSGKFGSLRSFSYLGFAFRWACSTVERGYSPAEASELRAIASFHHPQGFAYGYIKMV